MIDYEVDDTPFGRVLVPKGKWTTAFHQIMVVEELVGVYLNHARGWETEDLGFLESIPDIKYLKVIAYDRLDATPINSLVSLRYISLCSTCVGTIDFGAHVVLEDAFLEWWPGSRSILTCHSLRSLYLNRYKGDGLESWRVLKNLERLQIGNSALECLDGVENFSKLKHVGIYGCPKMKALQDYPLPKLTVLELYQSAIRNIAKLPESLEWFALVDNGPIDSLQNLKDCPLLKALLFYGTTFVVDGKLAFIESLSCLSRLSFQNRRHYDRTLQQLAPKTEDMFPRPDVLFSGPGA